KAAWPPPDSTEAHRQRLEAAQVEILPVRQVAGLQPEVRQAPEDGGEGDLGFEAGEGRTKAKMMAEAEGQVLVIQPGHVEAVRLGEMRGVAVGRRQEEEDKLPAA